MSHIVHVGNTVDRNILNGRLSRLLRWARYTRMSICIRINRV